MLSNHLKDYAEKKYGERLPYLKAAGCIPEEELWSCTPDEAVLMKFFYGTMPLRDAGEYEFGTFLSFVKHALWLRENKDWCAALPEDIFVNHVLYYRINSNMGSSYIQSQMEKLNGANNEEVVEETKKEVMNMLKKTIRPEFLNRIDETIMFLPLTEKDIKQIVLLQIKSVQKMLAGNGVELELTDAALDFLSQVGYDPEFGARPVKRAIQRYLLNDLSKKLLAQEVDRSKAIIVDAQGDGLVFRN